MSHTDDVSDVIRPHRWLTLLCVLIILTPLGIAAIKGGLWALQFDDSSGVPLPLFALFFVAAGAVLIVYGLFLVLRAWRTCVTISQHGMVLKMWTGAQETVNWAEEGPFELSCGDNGVYLMGKDGRSLYIEAINILPQALEARIKKTLLQQHVLSEGKVTIASRTQILSREQTSEPASHCSEGLSPRASIENRVFAAIVLLILPVGVCMVVQGFAPSAAVEISGIPIAESRAIHPPLDPFVQLFTEHWQLKLIVSMLLVGVVFRKWRDWLC